MKAEICPVCDGSGIYTYETEGEEVDTQCHGCDGRGWVEVSEGNSIPGYYDPDLCIHCGEPRSEPALTGCPKGSHYGTECEVGGNYHEPGAGTNTWQCDETGIMG